MKFAYVNCLKDTPQKYIKTVSMGQELQLDGVGRRGVVENVVLG